MARVHFFITKEAHIHFQLFSKTDERTCLHIPGGGGGSQTSTKLVENGFMW